MTVPALPRRWLLRHAEPLIAHGVCYGQLDISAHLDATQGAARQMARSLLQQAQQHPGVQLHISSSPLLRCQQLAQAVHAHLQQAGLPCQLDSDARLMEMHFGAWEGQRWDSISAESWHAWMADFAHWRVGGHGESVAAFMQRVQQLVQERGQPAANTWQLWVTHAGVIKAMELLAQGFAPQGPLQARQWPAHSCGYGKWLECPLLLQPLR